MDSSKLKIEIYLIMGHKNFKKLFENFHVKNHKKFFTFAYFDNLENKEPVNLGPYKVKQMEKFKLEMKNIKEQSLKDLEFYDAFLFYYSKLHRQKANF
jgi:serine protease inhibitor